MIRPAGGLWPHVRAALLCAVVAGNLVHAIPFPKKEVEDDDEAEWRAHDVERWHGWLSDLGLWRGSLAEFHDEVLLRHNQLATVGGWVQLPTRPVFRWLRSTQQWGLFGVVTEAPERLVVEVEVDGAWRMLERRLDPVYTWNDAIFRYRRVRGTWDTVKDDKPNPAYDAFCRWTARRAFADVPGATRVRIEREQIPVAAPWETLDDPSPKRLHSRELTPAADRLWVLR